MTDNKNLTLVIALGRPPKDFADFARDAAAAGAWDVKANSGASA
jgi:hypothetical protein